MLIPIVVAELRIHVWFRHVNSVSVLAETSTCIYEISADLEENSKSDRFFNVLGIFEMGKSAKVKSFVASWVILSMKFWQAHFITFYNSRWALNTLCTALLSVTRIYLQKGTLNFLTSNFLQSKEIKWIFCLGFTNKKSNPF